MRSLFVFVATLGCLSLPLQSFAQRNSEVDIERIGEDFNLRFDCTGFINDCRSFVGEFAKLAQEQNFENRAQPVDVYIYQSYEDDEPEVYYRNNTLLQTGYIRLGVDHPDLLLKTLSTRFLSESDVAAELEAKKRKVVVDMLSQIEGEIRDSRQCRYSIIYYPSRASLEEKLFGARKILAKCNSEWDTGWTKILVEYKNECWRNGYCVEVDRIEPNSSTWELWRLRQEVSEKLKDEAKQ